MTINDQRMKIDQQAFDRRFRELFTAMVEIAFEYVGRNKKEVDEVYVFGTMGVRGYYFNTCYRINGKMVETHEVNDVSVMKYPDLDERSYAMSMQGIDYLEETEQLFKDSDQKPPTLMKMVYHPKTGAFNNELDYELVSSDLNKTMNMFFEDWYVELGGKLS
ncbi:MAG TPA: hypothetical protein VKR41_02465 [Puia sp.]|nr:hypothetical protein [Puia sp.]